MWFLAGEELGELAVGPTECGEVARRGCLFAWNFTVTKTAVFTETERRSRPITALSLRYDSPPAYRLKIQPTKTMHCTIALSCSSACPFLYISTAPIGQISANYYIGVSMQVCLENSNLVTLGQNCHVLNMTEVRRIVKGNIKLP